MSTKIFEAYNKKKRTPNSYGARCPITPVSSFFQEADQYTVKGISKFPIQKNIEEKMIKNSATSFLMDQSLSKLIVPAMEIDKSCDNEYEYGKSLRPENWKLGLNKEKLVQFLEGVLCRELEVKMIIKAESTKCLVDNFLGCAMTTYQYDKVNSCSLDANQHVADPDSDTYCYCASELYIPAHLLEQGLLHEEVIINWEMVRRKFLPKTIPTDEYSCNMYLPHPEYRYPTLTPLLFLYYQEDDECRLYDPIEDKSVKVDRLHLRNFELVGSSLGGFLLLLNRVKRTFSCYDLSTRQWLTLSEMDCFRSEREFIGVTDGVNTIILLEIQDEVLVVHPFEVTDKEKVTQHPLMHYKVKAKVSSAVLSADAKVLCILMKSVGIFQAVRLDRSRGKISLRVSDLTRVFNVMESEFTCFVPSLWGTLLVVCFRGSSCLVYEALQHGGDVKEVVQVQSFQLCKVVLYLKPDGVGTILFPSAAESGGDLSTTKKADCLLLTSPGGRWIYPNFTHSTKRECCWPPADRCICQSIGVFLTLLYSCMQNHPLVVSLPCHLSSSLFELY